MDWWLIVLLVGGGILLALRLWLGPAEDETPPVEEWEGSEAIRADDTEPWEAEALARFGTEISVDQLIAEGRADELRGLGYEGDLPDG